MRQRCDPARSFFEAVDRGQTGEVVLPVDVHRAGTAHALPARSPEGQGRVDLVIDLDQGVESHRPAVIAIDSERIYLGVGTPCRIPAIDPETLDVLGRFRQRPVLTLPQKGYGSTHVPARLAFWCSWSS